MVHRWPARAAALEERTTTAVNRQRAVDAELESTAPLPLRWLRCDIEAPRIDRLGVSAQGRVPTTVSGELPAGHVGRGGEDVARPCGGYRR